MSSQWAPVVGYEGLYEASYDGRVRSLKRKTPKVLKPTLMPEGYLRICLTKNRLGKCFLLHRVVAEAFLKKISGKPKVNHKDGNKLNCAVDNLEWCYDSENITHSIDMGLRKRKLSKLEVIAILVQPFVSQRALAKRHRVSCRLIRGIRGGEFYERVD